ncbi:ketopantoate reductase family protein [Paraglaciecola sp. MB-3u-78]|uniref:ketopantoate reductase family protein n=1 Tax=Paraglaciecola sp. MB-3u-78 TaxID=2058332 RepID=UPI000C3282C4|nr:2-dehydropantoate 2-reductase [Paraglaciecola sp. MB-3u-78]PKG98563.1 2-dehydropantoate 2-reductase [Paraglaciecola sp. MB-3u-78]
MNILIIGCGAIGGFYASRLYRCCKSVTVTARGEHLLAIKKKGLKVTHAGIQSVCALTALDHTTLKTDFRSDQFDMIIVCLKANQLLTVLKDLEKWLELSTCPILSLQNGIDSESTLCSFLNPKRIWGGTAIKIGGEVVKPGEIVSAGIAKITYGPWPILKRGQMMPDELITFAKYLALANIPFELTSDIQTELWKKLVINNGVNPLSAITGLNTFELTHNPYYAAIVYAAMQETAAAALYDGVELTQQDIDSLFELIKNFIPIKTSMLIDKEKGRQIELEAIVGAVVKRCKQRGVPAPQNQKFLHRLSDLASKTC